MAYSLRSQCLKDTRKAPRVLTTWTPLSQLLMLQYVVGIIPVDGTVRDEYPLVQSRCQYKVLDIYTIAEVVQDYYSNGTISRDVEYVFPLPPTAAVCSFKAVIDNDKVVKGIVKEKGEAKKEYNKAVARGMRSNKVGKHTHPNQARPQVCFNKSTPMVRHPIQCVCTAFYHPTVFRVSLGNIKPKQKISVQ